MRSDFTRGLPRAVLRRQPDRRVEQGTARCVGKVPTLFVTKHDSFPSPNAKQSDVFPPSSLQSPAPHPVPGGRTGWEELISLPALLPDHRGGCGS